MTVKYEPADMVQVYLKSLQDAHTILVYLEETVTDRVLIRHSINQFKNNMDLNETVDEWKKLRLRKYGRNSKCTSPSQ